MLVSHRQSVGIFGDQTEVLYRPVAQAKSSFIAEEIMHIALGHPADRKLIHKKAKKQMQVFDVPGTDVEKQLRILSGVVIC